MSKRIAVILLSASLVGCGGCAAVLVGSGVAVGAAAVGWQRGWLKTTIDQPLERVQRAARSALADFRVALDSEGSGPTALTLSGPLRDGRQVLVRLKVVGEKTTAVGIHIGFWGDQDLSLKILEQLKKHL